MTVPRRGLASACLAGLMLQSILAVCCAVALAHPPLLGAGGARVSAFIANDVTWHSEVVASAARWVGAVSPRELHVYDMSMRVAGLLGGADRPTTVSNSSAGFLARVEMACAACRPGDAVVLMLVTAEACAPPGAEALRLPCDWSCVRVLWMCHNARRCVRCLQSSNGEDMEIHAPVTLVAPTGKMLGDLAAVGVPVLKWLPVIGDDWVSRGFKSEEDERGGRALRILVPGSVNFSKRNYEALRALKEVRPPPEVYVFGKCLSATYCAQLQRLALDLGEGGVSLTHSGNFGVGSFASYGEFREMVRQADFIVPCIDEGVWFANDYTQGGKLSASISLAIGTQTPLVAWCALLGRYGLREQICYDSSEFDTLRDAFSRASQLSSREYSLMREELGNIGEGEALRSHADLKSVISGSFGGLA